MKKNFVLDTNVLLHDPRALFHFADNNVIIPIYVIEELDRFKKDASELGRSARQVARYIDQYRLQGQLSGDGVPLGNGGGQLRVLSLLRSKKQRDAFFQDLDSVDGKILAVALDILEQEKESPTILITKDINLRIRANALGIDATDYDPEFIEIEELYTGASTHELPGHVIDDLFSQESTPIEQILKYTEEAKSVGNNEEDIEKPQSKNPFYPNQFLLIKDSANPKHSAVARVEPEGDSVKVISRRSNDQTWGIRPRNKEQVYALDLLMDDRVKLVTLVGKAGTGKTLLAIAAGLQMTLEEQKYQKVLVSRPIFPLGRDIGFLPGTMEEKLIPWMQPIFDNVEFLMGLNKQEPRSGRGYDELLSMGILQIEPLTYIRGRSLPHQFMIVDEAQNLTPHEVKTIITRAGEGTKIVLTGDPYQIDNPYVDASDNGLVHTLQRLKKEGIAGHITLQKGERSALAELAANLL